MSAQLALELRKVSWLRPAVFGCMRFWIPMTATPVFQALFAFVLWRAMYSLVSQLWHCSLSLAGVSKGHVSRSSHHRKARRGMITSARTTRETGEAPLRSCFTVPSAPCEPWRHGHSCDWVVRP
ncbi:hypothetical protein IG631_13820 [Alternaria alternata]|nr:hypothetical protein IG631_13820 [Alternaria alternata]